MKKVSNVRELAVLAGVHFTTVALGLRNDPRVAAKTRERIQRLAQETGYCPNPLVSELMTQRRLSKPTTQQACIAYLSHYPAPGLFNGSYWEKNFFLGAQAQAASLGYQMEEFCLRAPGMSQRRVRQILLARGIRALLIGPGAFGRTHLSFDISPFACLAVSHTMIKPLVHRISHHHYHGVLQAARRLRRLGYRRIGLVMTEVMDQGSDLQWSSGFAVFQQRLPKNQWVSPLYFDKSRPMSSAPLLKWVTTERVDAVIALSRQIYEFLVAEVPLGGNNLGFASLDLSPSVPGASGIDQAPRHIGCAGINQVVAQLHRGEWGAVERPITILLEGSWVDGNTTRHQPL
jgi:LacI family transcriptional regulator